MPLDVLLGFVDRISELALFYRMLTGEIDERILLVLEQAEVGKTCFLLKLAHECEQQDPSVPVVHLDFDQRRSGLTDYLSVAREVRRCLGNDCTPAICACENAIYHHAPLVSIRPGAGDGGVDFGEGGDFTGADVAKVAGRDLYQFGPISEAPPTADQIARQKAEMGRALHRDLAGLAEAHRRVVLLVDTFEGAPEETCGWLERWLFEPLRRELSHVLLVVAGRPECGSFFHSRPWGSLITAIDHFTPFGDDDILAHYHQRGLSVSETETCLIQIARSGPAMMAQLGDQLEQIQRGAR